MQLNDELKKKPYIFRHELKYLITRGDAEILKQRLGAFMHKDSHAAPLGYYKIRSIYFDDYWNSAYEEKMMGIASRCKYRLRVYNYSDDVINLERKLKQDSYVAKESAELSRTEAQMLLNGKYDFLLKNSQKLCSEFYYSCVTRLMKPRVIIDYEREPYVYPLGDVRITFDMDVRAALLNFDLFDPKLPTLGILENGNMILEVKYTQCIPSLIKKLLPQHVSPVIASSKYTLACDRVMPLFEHNRYN